ncbi:AcrR family transcriptional regulator [Cytobacillus horneckiae]|uniref:TetR/AcrR family transcriptional regulator n=1 Tax=Cytobacillus horneckiae TaxID=549687 RepID=A0A2N0ZJM0_9BACI|nr:TetR-like C-terminal domain-containing protein [Cytobacillus horneckiae]MBN6888622.1 TetR/AcrR family transcriptional regulator [Cytobacillus horneckiae]MCM3180528.1 TetR family transcriptional regulator C-terminal domain-containing protein [Cytobacillus horneckiae]MEC1158906.1 TetR-like C-terminal domain-containing protein [Cytobacillus horneckiae]MED2938673.1 TetR-like C-terminal domain-containing protein [Cytobacillus horneckiae]PKG29719.1 TetR/AcrR family transcriptional regulator [Cyto
MEKKIDRRKKYTRMVLKESLMKLLHNKPIASITIKEICELADINRSTFYSHYSDQYDLLYKIEDEIIQELNQTLLQYDYKKKKEMFAMTKYLLDYVFSRSEHFRILFSDNGNKGFQHRVMEAAQTHIMTNLEENHVLTATPSSKYITLFVISGSIHVIEKWLSNGMMESTEEMTKIITEISNNGMLHCSLD